MTKKDFQFIADQIKAVGDTFDNDSVEMNVLLDVANRFAWKLGEQNPRFQHELFLKACGFFD